MRTNKHLQLNQDNVQEQDSEQKKQINQKQQRKPILDIT